MIENEMGNRGSKSDLKFKSVKEQRVDGSYLSTHDKLRCTLMGFERNYQISIPSNQIIIPAALPPLRCRAGIAHPGTAAPPTLALPSAPPTVPGRDSTAAATQRWQSLAPTVRERCAEQERGH
jgi:hypothetical protein